MDFNCAIHNCSVMELLEGKRLMNRLEMMRGRPGIKYGIYNTKSKQFQFGISEDTPYLAQARLMQKIGDDARKWRFEVRRLPKTKTENFKI